MKVVRRILGIAAVFALVLGLVPGAASAQVPGSKPGVVRGSEWLLRNQLAGGSADIAFHYGRADDWPLMCDWNGDGSRTPAAVREREDGRWEWHLRNAYRGGRADVVFAYGRWDELDEPICGDWNGDGIQTPGVVRFPDHTGRLSWLLRDSNSSGPANRAFSYGRMDHHEDIPWVVVGDWNGTGVDTPGLVWFRDRLLWQLRDVNRAGRADREFWYGLGDRSPGFDFPVAGDWNDNGFDTVGVVRITDARMRWLLREATRGGSADREFSYGDPQEDDWPIVWR